MMADTPGYAPGLKRPLTRCTQRKRMSVTCARRAGGGAATSRLRAASLSLRAAWRTAAHSYWMKRTSG